MFSKFENRRYINKMKKMEIKEWNTKLNLNHKNAEYIEKINRKAIENMKMNKTIKKGKSKTSFN